MEPMDVQAGSIFIRSVWRTPLAKLKERFSTSCIAREFLRFARAPFLVESNSAWAIGDLRYDMEKGSGFAEVPLPQGAKDCPKFVPPWVPANSGAVGFTKSCPTYVTMPLASPLML